MQLFKHKNKGNFLFGKILPVVLTLLVGAVIGGVLWYQVNLQAVNIADESLVKVTIEKATTPSQIAQKLLQAGLIRSEKAFYIYARLSRQADNLQAGTYRLSPSESIPAIIEHLAKGNVDQFALTFYPGATLVGGTESSSKYSVTTALKKAGYQDDEIASALNQTYNGDLFDGKPAGADLEGYVYGDTYYFNTGVSAQEILQTTFDEFYKVIQDNDLQAKFASKGLNLYQGITLSSIVQREAGNPEDQKQIAQVFFSRLNEGIMLGSDVTYQYVADKTAVARDPSLDSPYNTRKYAGLPPGPIAVPGLSALQAVANPASGEYMYFLSGDDNQMHYAYTEAEHEANIVQYCKVKCSEN